MEILKIIYTGDLRTESTHIKSGETVLTDAPPDNNGKGGSFSPTDLLCSSLGACMLTVMGIVADKNKIDINHTTLKVSKIMKAEPRRVGEVIIEFQMPPQNYSEKEKELLENAAITCPVAKSLSPGLKQTVIFNY